MFHIREIITEIKAERICFNLSELKYLGFIPTDPKAIRDKNGRN
jgi:hypothetical protein